MGKVSEEYAQMNSIFQRLCIKEQCSFINDMIDIMYKSNLIMDINYPEDAKKGLSPIRIKIMEIKPLTLNNMIIRICNDDEKFADNKHTYLLETSPEVYKELMYILKRNVKSVYYDIMIEMPESSDNGFKSQMWITKDEYNNYKPEFK